MIKLHYIKISIKQRVNLACGVWDHCASICFNRKSACRQFNPMPWCREVWEFAKFSWHLQDVIVINCYKKAQFKEIYVQILVLHQIIFSCLCWFTFGDSSEHLEINFYPYFILMTWSQFGEGNLFGIFVEMGEKIESCWG